MVDTIGRLGSIPTHGDPGLEAASDAARQSARLYDQLTPFRPKDDRKTIVSPVAYPAGDDAFHAASRASLQCWRQGCR